MTVEEINQRVEVIRAESFDYEAAHSDEDNLRDAVLKAIAAGTENAAEMAKAVLATNDIEFDRWCA